MNGVHQPRESEDQTSETGDTVDPFLLDLPTADPADLPVLTLDPLALRCVRDRDDPISTHRTRRNQR